MLPSIQVMRNYINIHFGILIYYKKLFRDKISQMYFITPYLLTYLCFFSFAYLIGMYAFIHHHLCQLYQISKTHLGLCNGIMSLVSTLGVIAFFIYTIQIKKNIVTFFTWGSIGLMFSYCLIVFSSIAFQGKSPKIFFYISVTLIGIFRSIFIQCLLIMVKMHKEIYDQNNFISEHNYKFLINIWPASFGMAIAFFVCNWLEYNVQVKWELLVLIGVSLKLLTTTFLYFGLRNYLETNQNDTIEQMQNKIIVQKSQGSTETLTLLSFFTLLKDHLPSKLFLINSTLLDTLHIGFCYVLPAFFYALGYKGNQGYLTAIYSLSLIAGTYAIAISDYLLHIFVKKTQKKEEDSNNNKSKKGSTVYMFIFSVSLLFFLITLIILSFLSFQTQQYHQNQNESNQYVNLLMILMCALGFFFGGPLKSYFSQKTIKVMENFQKQSQRRTKYDSILKIQQEKTLIQTQAENSSVNDNILGHKLQASSSLITANRITTYFMAFVVFITSFYLVDKYLPYTMVFFSIIGLVALVFDIIQNFVLMKEEQQNENERQVQDETV